MLFLPFSYTIKIFLPTPFRSPWLMKKRAAFPKSRCCRTSYSVTNMPLAYLLNTRTRADSFRSSSEADQGAFSRLSPRSALDDCHWQSAPLWNLVFLTKSSVLNCRGRRPRRPACLSFRVRPLRGFFFILPIRLRRPWRINYTPLSFVGAYS